jgi:aminopeptidase YwaD
VTIVAHIDTKPGTPGALDNGTGVVALLQMAADLADRPFDGAVGIEFLVVNGEDNYAAPGEMAYLRQSDLAHVALAVNFDGVGLPGGPSAWSLYECPPGLRSLVTEVLAEYPALVEGPPWFQSDHAIFAAQGRPALALTSADLATALGSVAHAATDTPDGVDLVAVGDAARAVAAVVRAVAAPHAGPTPAG